MHALRLLRAVVAACLLAGTVAGPARAQSGESLALSGPPDSASVAAGAPLELHARAAAGDTGLELRVSRSAQATDACGRIGADVAHAAGAPLQSDPALFTFATGRWYTQSGTYYWQVSRVAPDGTCTATEVRRLVLAPATGARPQLGALARLSHQRIPSRIGSSNGASYVIRTGGIPHGLSRARFLALVRNSGQRWGLHSLGTRPGRPVLGNGVSEVGFSTALVPRAALAVTIFAPPFRVRSAGGERDLVLRADLPWEAGPRHPSRARVDLETVLLHEFGHVAGNRFHVPRGCRDTPMVVALDTGEWWRSTTDFFYRACKTAG